MIKSTRIRFTSAIASASLSVLFGAGCGDPDLDSSPTESTQGPVVNGDAVADTSPFAKVQTSGGLCSGTMLDARTVLTAAHCVVKGLTPGKTLPASTFSVVVGTTTYPAETAAQAAWTVADSAVNDVALIRLTSAVPTPNSAAGGTAWPALYSGTESSLLNTVVDCYGYGSQTEANDGSSGVLRRGDDLTVTAAGGGVLTITEGKDKEKPSWADSGSGCYKRAGGNLTQVYVHHGEYKNGASIPSVRNWINGLKDFSNPRFGSFSYPVASTTDSRSHLCESKGYLRSTSSDSKAIAKDTTYLTWKNGSFNIVTAKTAGEVNTLTEIGCRRL